MSAISAALGSVLGYLGAEVAPNSYFERLLWPQRFYNHCTWPVMLRLTLLTAMGGPLHRAALDTLQNLLRHGLYQGILRGKMLGTAFYTCRPQIYIPRSGVPDQGKEKETRNCLWIEVLSQVNAEAGSRRVDPSTKDGQKPLHEVQTIFQLHLHALTTFDDQDAFVTVQEDLTTWQVLLGIVCSEFSAMVVAICVGAIYHYYWLSVYFCVPVLLKILALCCRLRRQPIDNGILSSYIDSVSGKQAMEVFEIANLDRNFAIIESPDVVFRQFVRHYGHPLRDGRSVAESKIRACRSAVMMKKTPNFGAQSPESTFDLWTLRSDRIREVVNILIVYAFVLYFPVGLLLLVWERNAVQYIWLGYQLYLVLMMHIARLAGWDGSARLEQRIAYHLQNGESVCLQSRNGQAVVATLDVTSTLSVKLARDEVAKLIEKYTNPKEYVPSCGGTA